MKALISCLKATYQPKRYIGEKQVAVAVIVGLAHLVASVGGFSLGRCCGVD